MAAWLVSAAWSAPAAAQTGASIAVSTDELFRGNSISDGSASVRAAASLDAGNGFYLGASASLALPDGDPAVVGTTQYAGYAVRKGATDLDFGIVHRRYRRAIDREYRRDYVEVYAGLTGRLTQARLFISPDYAREGGLSAYAEVGSRLASIRGFHLNGKAGLFILPHEGETEPYVDGSLAIARRVAGVDLSFGIAYTTYPAEGDDGSPRVFLSASKAF